jgi:hypothetical protein
MLCVDENNCFRLNTQSVCKLALPQPQAAGQSQRAGVWDDVSIAAQFARIPMVGVASYPLQTNARNGANPLASHSSAFSAPEGKVGGDEAHGKGSGRGDAGASAATHAGLQSLSPYTMIARHQGTEKDHANALCSALLGLGQRAFVVQGHDHFGGERHWVVVLRADAEPRFWQPRYAECVIESVYERVYCSVM